MEYRPFGQTDLQVSVMGFGCWEMGGTYGKIDTGQLQQAVRRAIDVGINCFDTAEAYGMGASEQVLARALGERRKDVAIVTKFGVGYEEAPNRRDSSRQRVMASIEKSLQNLQTDYVDVYLVHWPDVNTPFEETMRALDDIVQQGKARYIGVSNFRLAQLEACMRLRRVDVVQFGENDWRSRAGQMGVLNLFRTLFGPDYFPRNLRAVEELKALAAEYHKTLPQFALRWTTSHPAISVALVGCRQASEVEENLGALGWAISEGDMATIDAIFARHNAVTMPPGWLEDD